MNPTMLLLVAVALVAAWPAAASALPAAKMDERHQQLLSANCYSCHGPETQEGGVRLDDLPLSISSVAAAERWQKVLNVLNSGEMPPEDEPQPDPQVKLEFLADLSQQMVVARKALADQGGRITMRRLSRREYTNTIQDLLGVEPDVSLLPEDGKAGVFDTVGSGLFMSGDQVEQYLAVGRKALEEHRSRLANDPGRNGTHAGAPPRFTIRFQPEEDPVWPQAANLQRWLQGIVEAANRAEYDEDELARGIRAAMESRRTKQWDGGYDALTTTIVKLCFEWDKAGRAPRATDFGFPKPFDKLPDYPFGWTHPANDLLDLPARDTGIYLMPALGHFTRRAVPAEQKKAKQAADNYSLPPGRYMLRIHAGFVPEAPHARRFILVGSSYRPSKEFAEQQTWLSTHEVLGTRDAPQTIEAELRVAPGTKVPQLSFWFQERQHETTPSRMQVVNALGKEYLRPAIWVDWYELAGPLPEPDVEEVVVANTGGVPEAEHARSIVERFASHAFRGQTPEPTLVDGLMAVYDRSRGLGEDFDTAILEPLSMVLALPQFLYLAEPVADESPRPLSDVEFANRLAYFLWSGPPDQPLLEAARSGRLADQGELDRQVTRMLADPRAMRGIEGLLFQWLALHRLDLFPFEWKRAPFFGISTREAARREVYETYADMLRNGRPLGELLKSDSVVINGMLAAHYGLDGVAGDDFRRVKLPAGSPRGGLLGMAAIMAMGSNGSITNPVERGAWVLRKLLADPPPPAPPNVPQISDKAKAGLKPRERLVAHQQEPQCAACHRKIDPLGFGLENFDVAGVWRERDSLRPDDPRAATWPIDAAGALHGGPSFQDFFALRDVIASRQRDFARGYAEALIQFALGRTVGFSDGEFVDSIVAEAEKRNFATDAFVRALVQSPQFRSK